MKILAKIRALFNLKDKRQELVVSAAEVRGNSVYLHPLGDKKHTIHMKASQVDILINPVEGVEEENIRIITNKPSTPQSTNKSDVEKVSKRRRVVNTHYMSPPMKTVSMRLYLEEYEMLMDAIQSNGYRKTEYLLACVTAAKKNSFDATYKQFYNDHQERRKAARIAARKSGKITSQ